MNEGNNKERQTRSNRKMQSAKSVKVDRTLNYLIALVCIGIVITAAYVFIWQDDVVEKADKSPEVSLKDESKKEKPEKDNEKEELTKEDNAQEDIVKDEETSTDEEESKVTEKAVEERQSDDPIVDTVITDSNWKATPTSQTRGHVSSYDPNSVDWKEKVTTIANATQLAENDMIIWFLKNNGSADTAIGTVSSKDKVEKFRVSIEWVEGEGWKPVQVEKLNTLEGAY